MALTEADVLHIAKLSDLALDADEVSRLRHELGAILRHVEQLSELDTRDIPPTAHVEGAALPLRPDVPEAGLDAQQATAAAPRVVAGAFAVPKFVDD